MSPCHARLPLAIPAVALAVLAPACFNDDRADGAETDDEGDGGVPVRPTPGGGRRDGGTFGELGFGDDDASTGDAGASDAGEAPDPGRDSGGGGSLTTLDEQLLRFAEIRCEGQADCDPYFAYYYDSAADCVPGFAGRIGPYFEGGDDACAAALRSYVDCFESEAACETELLYYFPQYTFGLADGECDAEGSEMAAACGLG